MNIKPIKINHNLSDSTWDFIHNLEQHYNVKFVVVTQVKTCDGNWTDGEFYIFYQANPDKQMGHSHYMGYGFDKTGGYVFNALPYVNSLGGISAVKNSLTGEVIYSKYRHDYVTMESDPNIFIDGGRNYTRMGGSGTPVTLQIVDDELKIVCQ